MVRVTTGQIQPLLSGYDDAVSFYQRLRVQLGLPLAPSGQHTVPRDIIRVLAGRPAVIVVDNLETVQAAEVLIEALTTIASRDIRVIVTTRHAPQHDTLPAKVIVVQLNPLSNPFQVAMLLEWHIERYTPQHYRLEELRPALSDQRLLHRLIKATGGNPLLIQIVVSEVARTSWSQLDSLPHLYGPDLLNYLYEQAWQEIFLTGAPGLLAQQILHWISGEQARGRQVTTERLQQFVVQTGELQLFSPSIRLLQERFLLINQDMNKGNYAIVPSLVEFLIHHP
jgi:hypothetical protein